MSGTPLITLRQGVYTYPAQGGCPPQTALRGVDFCLRAGEHVALMGANGAGKSTLLRLLGGLAWLEAGSLVWHTDAGDETSPLAGREQCALISAAEQENYIRQGWQITGEELLDTAFSNSPLLYTPPSAAQTREARELAATWGIEALLKERVPALSQGQLRVLLLARALLRRTPVLLLDEYTDGMDATLRTRMPQILRHAAAHATLLMTAHRPETIPALVQKRVWLYDGLLHDTPAPNSAPDVATYPTSTAGQAAPAADCAPSSLHTPTTGATPPVPSLVQLRNATIYVERTEVLHSIDWTWRQGEHWHIHGANGAGKSTFLRLLAGDEYPADGGEIHRYLPRNGGPAHDLEHIRRGVRLVSDAAQAVCYGELTALQTVLCGLDNTAEPYRDFSEAETRQALTLLERLNVAPLATRRAGTLSTGQLRRVLLCRALMGTPDMLLLDEPCSGMDAATRAAAMPLLQEAVLHGAHLLIVSHHPADVPPCVTHTALMQDGRLMPLGLSGAR